MKLSPYSKLVSLLKIFKSQSIAVSKLSNLLELNPKDPLLFSFNENFVRLTLQRKETALKIAELMITLNLQEI